MSHRIAQKRWSEKEFFPRHALLVGASSEHDEVMLCENLILEPWLRLSAKGTTNAWNAPWYDVDEDIGK